MRDKKQPAVGSAGDGSGAGCAGSSALYHTTSDDPTQYQFAARTVAEVVAAFETLLAVLQHDVSADELEPLAELPQLYLAELDESDRAEAITALRVLAAAKGDAGARACGLVGIPLPEIGGVLDDLIAGVAAGLLAELSQAEGPERDSLIDTLLSQVANMPPVMAERYRDLIVRGGFLRASFVDEELRRRCNGREPAVMDDNEPKHGRPRKRKLVTDDYIELYKGWGYDARLNLCNDDVEVNSELLTDVTEAQIMARVRDHGTNHDLSINVQHAKEAIVTVAAQRAYHPIKNYLEALQWDGGQHIKALTEHFIDKDSAFPRWIRHWLVGAVARVFEGYQNPMLVFDGGQDQGKSFFARWLCPLPGYFLESPIYPENKDCRLRLIQAWVWEVSELGTTTRKADIEALKAFLTTQTVRERQSYGRRDIIKPALASFIGTINNESGFLVDRTGNRRFLVCTLIGIDWSYADKIDVAQLWAEALHLYRDSDDWRLSDNDKTRRDQQNDEYLVDDPIEVYILKNYEFTDQFSDRVLLAEVFNTLDLYNIKPNRGTAMTVAGVMQKCGAIKKREMVDGTQQRVYRGVKTKSICNGDSPKSGAEIADDIIAETGF